MDGSRRGTHLAIIRKKLCWNHLKRQWAASGGSESPIAGGSQGKTEAPVEHGCRGNESRGRKAELQKCRCLSSPESLYESEKDPFFILGRGKHLQKRKSGLVT